MKTLILFIIVCAIVASSFFLGMKIGRKNTNQRITSEYTLPIKRVFNLIILDESGSMNGLQEVSVCGVNETLQTIRNAYKNYPQQEQFVTVATFSGSPRSEQNTCRVRRELQSITEVKNLELSEFNPDGLTPLWDTMGKLLTELEVKVSKGDLVLVTIITDGCENSSVKYDSKKINQLVTRLDKMGWTFTYIGANQDAALAAKNMGIKNSYQYSSDYDGTRNMYEKEKRSRMKFYQRSRVATDMRTLQDKYFDDEEEGDNDK